MEDGFGVGVVGVTVAGLFQGGAETGVIENFAVEDDLQMPIFIAHRLMTAGHVDNAEPAVSERDKIVAKEPAAIRTAMSDAIRHRPEQIPVYISTC